MNKERFNSSWNLLYLTAGVLIYISLSTNYHDWNSQDYLTGFALLIILLLIAYFSTTHAFLEIRDGRTFINSGYWDFRQERSDIFNIKYIYRFPDFIFKEFGTRMVIYVKNGADGLRQISVREKNFSNETIIKFLTRIKEINPNIELDAEYEQILKGEREKDEPSYNTVKSVEDRLRAKGESW